MNHTPGKWYAEERFDDDTSLGLAVYDTDEIVCSLPGVGEGDFENAALIAASPDLLEALSMALPLLRGHQETPKGKARYEAAHAAIAKATGEEE